MRIHATRSALALAAGSAAVFVVLLSGAQAEAGPAAVHPSVDVASAKVSGGVLHFAVDVTFPPPGQSRPSSACKGKVKLTEVLKGRRQAPHWTGQLGPDDGLCAARVKGSLPAGLLNHKVSFTISFGGNGGVAPFSHALKLKLSPPAGKGGGNGGGVGSPSPGGNAPGLPAVVFTAADGVWESQSTGGGLFIRFTVKDGSIQKHFSSSGSSLLLICDMEDGSQKAPFGYLLGLVYDQPVALDPSGHFSDHYVRTFEQEYPEYTLKFTVPQAVHGILGATTGEMTYDVTDASFSAGGHTQSGCDGSVTLNAYKE